MTKSMTEIKSSTIRNQLVELRLRYATSLGPVASNRENLSTLQHSHSAELHGRVVENQHCSTRMQYQCREWSAIKHIITSITSDSIWRWMIRRHQSCCKGDKRRSSSASCVFYVQFAGTIPDMLLTCIHALGSVQVGSKNMHVGCWWVV